MEVWIISESRVDQGSDEDFQAGHLPCFFFYHFSGRKIQLTAMGAPKTLIHVASLLKSLYLLTL
jgi:hypothetical protein